MTIIMTVIKITIIITMIIITMIIVSKIITTTIRVERGGEPVLGASVRADITGPGGKLQHLRLEVKTTHSKTPDIFTKYQNQTQSPNTNTDMVRTQAVVIRISPLVTAPTRLICQKSLPGVAKSPFTLNMNSTCHSCYHWPTKHDCRMVVALNCFSAGTFTVRIFVTDDQGKAEVPRRGEKVHHICRLGEVCP